MLFGDSDKKIYDDNNVLNNRRTNFMAAPKLIKDN